MGCLCPVVEASLTGSAVSPNIWGAKMFDFMWIPLFSLGYRLSKTKMTTCYKIWGNVPVALSPPVYAYVSDTIVSLAIPVLVAASRGYRALLRLPFHFCFYCRFDFLHRKKCMYSHPCMCFQTWSAFLSRNLSVWEIYLCWLITRNSLQSLIPLVF